MQRIVVAGVGLPLLALLLVLPERIFAAVVQVILAVAVFEMIRALVPDKPLTLPLSAAAATSLFVSLTRVNPDVPLWSFLAITGAALVLILRPNSRLAVSIGGWWITACRYVGVLGAHLVLLRMEPNGQEWLALMLAATFATDTGAYAVGRTLGRHAFWPAVSPNKTWEGAIGGLASGAIVGVGAMFALVGFGLWAGRQHFGAVLSAALGRGGDRGDGEMVSYRRAALGVALGWGVMIGWLWQSGVPLWVAPVVVVTAFAIFVGLTRAIVDGGLATIVPAMIPLGFVLSAFGTETLGVAGVVAMGFTLVWCGDLLTFMMAPTAHSVRLADEVKTGKRRFVWGLLLAMGVSLAVSVFTTIALGHKHGAANLHQQYFQGFAQYPAAIAAQKLRNPSPPDAEGWMWTGVGAGVMALLTLASYRFSWWPLHPLGYMVSPAWIMRSLWFPFFVAWAIKNLVLRFGSLALYNRSRDPVYGIIIGQIVVAGFWLLIDLLTGTTGNQIRVY